jgi:hypothetical protein
MSARHQPSASEASDAHQAEMQKMIADMMPSPSDPASTKDFKQADMRSPRRRGRWRGRWRGGLRSAGIEHASSGFPLLSG